jgi:hypothetical protein
MIDELFLEDEESLFDIDIESEISDRDPASALIDAARYTEGACVTYPTRRRSLGAPAWSPSTVTRPPATT